MDLANVSLAKRMEEESQKDWVPLKLDELTNLVQPFTGDGWTGRISALTLHKDTDLNEFIKRVNKDSNLQRLIKQARFTRNEIENHNGGNLPLYYVHNALQDDAVRAKLSKCKTYEEVVKYISKITCGKFTVEMGFKLFDGDGTLMVVVGACTKRHIVQDKGDDKSAAFWDQKAALENGNATGLAYTTAYDASFVHDSGISGALTMNGVGCATCLPLVYVDKNGRVRVHCCCLTHVASEVIDTFALVLCALMQCAISQTNAEQVGIVSFAGKRVLERINKLLSKQPLTQKQQQQQEVDIVDRSGAVGHLGYARQAGMEDLLEDFFTLCEVMGLDFGNESHAGRILCVFMNMLFLRFLGGTEKTREAIMDSFKKHGLEQLLENPVDFDPDRIWRDVLPAHIREQFDDTGDTTPIFREILRMVRLPTRGFGGRNGGKVGGKASVASHGGQMRNGGKVGGKASVASHGGQMRTGGKASVASHGSQMRNCGRRPGTKDKSPKDVAAIVFGLSKHIKDLSAFARECRQMKMQQSTQIPKRKAFNGKSRLVRCYEAYMELQKTNGGSGTSSGADPRPAKRRKVG